VVLLAVLIMSYRQVIAAFPDGGGAYAVAKTRLGRGASLVAAASLVVDYVLNVAVAVAAGVAALTSAFPVLLPYTVELCLAVLVVITAVNLRGVAHSARVFMAPTVVFVAVDRGLSWWSGCCGSPPADPALLERALVNILANAARYRVIDHGPGIPATEWDRIFVPFQRLGDRLARPGGVPAA
jgi:hypothetical protein